MGVLLTGKVVVVTGAAGGIGRASALVMAREGAKIAVADIMTAGGEETVAMIDRAGGEAFFVPTDVSKADDVEAMVAKTVERFGRLDGAYNNAGIHAAHREARTADVPEDDWDRVLAINLKGIWLCMKYEIRQMLTQGGGAIVNASSICGLIGSRNFILPAYTASKHGVTGLTRVAAQEYAKDGLRINAVAPGPIKTAMTQGSFTPGVDPAVIERERYPVPIGRRGDPEEVGEAVAWLLSDKASFITGNIMEVDGGWTE